MGGKLVRGPVSAVVICLLCSGQEQQETAKFRTGTTLIEFTIVAVDGKGNPVKDLRKEEIFLTEQSQPRDLAFFRFEGGADAAKPKPLPPGVFTNRAEYTTGPLRNITAILIDALNTPPTDQPYSRDQVLTYLRDLPRDTRAAVFGLARELMILHDFTDDIESLRTRVEEAFRKKFPIFISPDVKEADCLLFECAGPPPRLVEAETVYYQHEAERRRERTLGSLEALGDHLAGIPGRKSLIWIGGGVSIYSMTGALGFGKYGGFKSYEAQIRKTAQRLASQGIAVYPVDSKGLVRGTIPPPKPVRYNWDKLPDLESLRNTVLTNFYPESTNDVLAETTGGRVVRLTNDLTRGMQYAASDQRASYSVGFYAAGEPDNKWHGIQVKTNRRGVKLTYRQGYLSEAPPEQSPNWSEEQWRAAILNPVGSTEVRLDARLEPVAGTEPGTYGLLLQIEGATFRKESDKMFAELDVLVAEKTPQGDFTSHLQAAKLTMSEDHATLRYRYRWKIKHETTIVRLIVRDRYTGRYGALDVPVSNTPAKD